MESSRFQSKGILKKLLIISFLYCFVFLKNVIIFVEMLEVVYMFSLDFVGIFRGGGKVNY